jgi:hypothetical protein
MTQRKIVRYYLISRGLSFNITSELEEAVNKAIEKGHSCMGGVSVVFNGLELVAFQAMVEYEDIK